MTDLTFFTNEEDSTLLERFTKTLKYVQYFDVLVGYFRTNGFYLLQDSIHEYPTAHATKRRLQFDEFIVKQ